jgi:light-regulated signal transduction histidine kinase (bacteriophytochrome)
MNASKEVVELIATLHKTEERLEELTAGEVDSVMSGEGRTLLLRHAQDQLRLSEAAKQEAIGQLELVNQELETFSYSVSHDLRAPLRHILGFVEMLRQDAGPSLPEECRGYLVTICRSAVRMGELIDDLLTFSQTGRAELQKTDVDPGQLVLDALSDFPVETDGRDIVWKIDPLPPLWADRALLRMVMVNLISNALKFTSVRARPEIEIGCAPDDRGETVLFIRDNGAGFDPRYADKLFGVFQRLHSQSEFEGTGIGLANVQRIVHRHGGRTWAQGVVDGGATFYFSLPKKPQPSP